MTTRTMIGMLIGPHGGMARQARLVQPELRRIGPHGYVKPPPELRRTVFALDALRMRSVQREVIRINVDHDHALIVGQVQHVELAANESAWMVGVVHGGLPDGPLYLSPESDSRRDGSDLVVNAVAVCRDPAQICLEPVLVLDGGLERRRDWRLSGRHAAIAERAATIVKRRKYGDPLVVVDTDDARAEAREVRELELEMRMSGGPLWHGSAGRVISVR